MAHLSIPVVFLDGLVSPNPTYGVSGLPQPFRCPLQTSMHLFQQAQFTKKLTRCAVVFTGYVDFEKREIDAGHNSMQESGRIES